MSKGGWREFVHDHGIPWRSGSGRTNYEIHCPFCGSNDGSKHMGLDLESPAWGCWKDDRHRGYNPGRLIQKLTNCSDEASDLLCQAYFDTHIRPDKARHLLNIQPVIRPREFYEFGELDPTLDRPFIKYLKRRNLDPHYVIPRFKLHLSLSGAFAYRLILPVVHEGNWYTWIGRTIGDNLPKYKAAPDSLNGTRPSDYLFDYENLNGGKVLVVNEGYFDAMSVTGALIAGVDSTALAGKVVTERQTRLLSALSPAYEFVVWCLDPDAYATMIRHVNQLSVHIPNIRPLRLDDGD